MKEADEVDVVGDVGFVGADTLTELEDLQARALLFEEGLVGALGEVEDVALVGAHPHTTQVEHCAVELD